MWVKRDIDKSLCYFPIALLHVWQPVSQCNVAGTSFYLSLLLHLFFLSPGRKLQLCRWVGTEWHAEVGADPKKDLDPPYSDPDKKSDLDTKVSG